MNFGFDAVQALEFIGFMVIVFSSPIACIANTDYPKNEEAHRTRLG